MLNLELRELVRAGATEIQIDEPYYSGFPEDIGWGIRAVNALVEGVGARIGLHVCYGNRYGKPSWEGSYRYLFPAVLDARVQQLTLEFARRGEDDVALFAEFEPPFDLGLGVIDVKIHDVETPAIVAERIREALRDRADRPAGREPRLRARPSAARRSPSQSSEAMVAGAAIVRRELGAA